MQSLSFFRSGFFVLLVLFSFPAASQTVSWVAEANTESDVPGAVFMGLGVSPDNKNLYVAGEHINVVNVYRLKNNKSTISQMITVIAPTMVVPPELHTMEILSMKN